MLLILLAYLGGILTILSPCILPVLPFVFSRADRPFASSGLPILIGMAVTFALIATLAAIGGGWAVAANDYGRLIALAIMAVFGLTLIFPSLSERLMRPVVALGNRLGDTAGSGSGQSSVWSSLVLGAATGLLWAPCAGPILGLILTGAALEGASTHTTLLLVAYAAGAATSLALALLAGGRIFAAMKKSLGAGEHIRRGLGVAVLAAVAAIGLGADTGFLTRLSLASTAPLEQRLVDLARGNAAEKQEHTLPRNGEVLPVEGRAPTITGAAEWLNSKPLTPADLKGKVVLVDFWTYSCINCLRAIPYVRAWAEKYRDKGLIVIGVHSPEFAFEKNIDNVRKAVADLKIDYPVAIDNTYSIWRAFKNQYWPAHYFIDADGNIRHHHFGEGGYQASERVIRELLAEAGAKDLDDAMVKVSASGAQAPSVFADIRSPETYLGYARAANFTSPGGAERDAAHQYEGEPGALNQWTLNGNWTIGREHAQLNSQPGRILFRFHARDLHLVLGPAADGKPVRFRVMIDGKEPAENHGADTAGDGSGVVTSERLYQLVRQHGALADHTFSIEFLDPGVKAYAFTFG